MVLSIGVSYEKLAEYHTDAFHVGYDAEAEGGRRETKPLQSGPVSFTWPTSSAIHTLQRSSESQWGSSSTLFIRLYPITVRSVVG